MTLIDDNGHIRHPNVDDVIREVKSRAAGRTRYEGQEPRWDEVLVAEIERLREAIRGWTSHSEHIPCGCAACDELFRIGVEKP